MEKLSSEPCLLNAGDRRALNTMASSLTTNDKGEPEISPCWSSDARPPPNHDEALVELDKLTKQLERREGLRPRYEEALQKWLDKGFDVESTGMIRQGQMGCVRYLDGVASRT